MSASNAASRPEPAIRVMMMPRDTNAQGTIFGGVILSYLDQAGAIEARKLGAINIVTVAMDKVEFKEPVFVGDVLSFFAEVIKVGKTSIHVRVNVEAQRWENPKLRVAVTSAQIVYVAIDDSRRPAPIQIT